MARTPKGRSKRQTFGVTPPPRLDDVGLQPTVNPAYSAQAAAEIASLEGLQSQVSAGAGPMYDRQRTYPATDLVPAEIYNIFQQADRGNWMVAYGDLNQDLHGRDYQLHTLDRGRRATITTKKIILQASDPSDPVSVGMRNAYEAMIDGIDDFNAGVYSMLSANGPGYSLTEPIWKFGTVRFKWNGSTVPFYGLHPRELKWVHPRHLYFPWDSDAPHINLGSDGMMPLSEAPHKWIWYRALGDGLASTRGYLRPAAWLHLMKNTSLVSGAIALKMFGIPQLAAYLDEAQWKSATVQETVIACLQSYGSGTPTVFPAFLKDKIKAEPGPLISGGVDFHMRWVGFLDACMAKVVEGAVLQTESSSGGPGSYAQSKTHENKSYDVSVCDAVGTCEAIRSQLFRAWAELNATGLAKVFGVPPDEILGRIPTASRRLDREVTPKERAEILCMFLDRGLEGSVNQIRNEYAYDAPADKSDVLHGMAVTIAGDGAAVSPSDAADGVKNPKPAPSAQEQP